MQLDTQRLDESPELRITSRSLDDRRWVLAGMIMQGMMGDGVKSGYYFEIARDAVKRADALIVVLDETARPE